MPNSLINLYIFILFTLERNFQRSLAVTSRPLTLSCQRRLYLHPAFAGAVFFFRLAICLWLLAALLSLKEIVVGGIPCSIMSLGLSLLNTHFFTALRANVSSVSRTAFRWHWLVFFTLCHPYCFFCFRTMQLALSGYCLGRMALGIKSI